MSSGAHGHGFVPSHWKDQPMYYENAKSDFEDVLTLDYDDLRKAGNVAKNTRNADRWNALEWLRLYEAYTHSGWDMTPDDWTEEQVTEALNPREPKAPEWDNDMHPIEGTPFNPAVRL